MDVQALIGYVQHTPECATLIQCGCGHRFREHLGWGEKCVHNPVSCPCAQFVGVECTCGLSTLLSLLERRGPAEK